MTASAARRGPGQRGVCTQMCNLRSASSGVHAEVCEHKCASSGVQAQVCKLRLQAQVCEHRCASRIREACCCNKQPHFSSSHSSGALCWVCMSHRTGLYPAGDSDQLGHPGAPASPAVRLHRLLFVVLVKWDHIHQGAHGLHLVAPTSRATGPRVSLLNPHPADGPPSRGLLPHPTRVCAEVLGSSQTTLTLPSSASFARLRAGSTTSRKREDKMNSSAHLSWKIQEAGPVGGRGPCS